MKLKFTEMLYSKNIVTALINTNNWMLSDASKQLSNDILIQVWRRQELDSGVTAEISQ
jgi:hypothetical protein